MTPRYLAVPSGSCDVKVKPCLQEFAQMILTHFLITMNIKRFLSSHPEFSLVPFSVGDISAPLGHVTLTPDIHGTDGFFIFRLRRL
jgi:hypothetical protein